MHKELLISRHAKSSWSDSSLPDHDRPLNQRGLRDAPAMAGWLQERGLVPELVLTSSAVRARTTAKLFCETWQSEDIEPMILEELYLADPPAYIEALTSYATDARRVMVVGHNPGLEYLLECLTGEDTVMATATIAHVRFEANHWLEESKGTLIDTYRPKEVLS